MVKYLVKTTGANLIYDGNSKCLVELGRNNESVIAAEVTVSDLERMIKDTDGQLRGIHAILRREYINKTIDDLDKEGVLEKSERYSEAKKLIFEGQRPRLAIALEQTFPDADTAYEYITRKAEEGKCESVTKETVTRWTNGATVFPNDSKIVEVIAEYAEAKGLPTAQFYRKFVQDRTTFEQENRIWRNCEGNLYAAYQLWRVIRSTVMRNINAEHEGTREPRNTDGNQRFKIEEIEYVSRMFGEEVDEKHIGVMVTEVKQILEGTETTEKTDLEGLSTGLIASQDKPAKIKEATLYERVRDLNSLAPHILFDLYNVFEKSTRQKTPSIEELGKREAYIFLTIEEKIFGKALPPELLDTQDTDLAQRLKPAWETLYQYKDHALHKGMQTLRNIFLSLDPRFQDRFFTMFAYHQLEILREDYLKIIQKYQGELEEQIKANKQEIRKTDRVLQKNLAGTHRANLFGSSIRMKEDLKLLNERLRGIRRLEGYFNRALKILRAQYDKLPERPTEYEFADNTVLKQEEIYEKYGLDELIAK